MNEVMGLSLIIAGLAAEFMAVRVAVTTKDEVGKISADTQNVVGEVLKALIAKLPWIAVMGLTTIILGMVLLMDRWPWHASP